MCRSVVSAVIGFGDCRLKGGDWLVRTGPADSVNRSGDNRCLDGRGDFARRNMRVNGTVIMELPF